MQINEVDMNVQCQYSSSKSHVVNVAPFMTQCLNTIHPNTTTTLQRFCDLQNQNIIAMNKDIQKSILKQVKVVLKEILKGFKYW